MRRLIRHLVIFCLALAVYVAAQPYLHFLFAPPDDQADRWMITVIALGCAAAMATFLRNMREADREKSER